MNKTNIFGDGWRESAQGERFQRGHLSLTDPAADHGIGASAYRVQPGRRAFPKHAHLANDEALYIVAGRGELTIGDESGPVTAGDFVMLPRGEAYAHVLVNDGDEELVYLCLSTTNLPEVVQYPDSGKLGVIGAKGAWGSGAGVSGIFRTERADYWDGES